jgi:hypothetical protein
MTQLIFALLLALLHPQPLKTTTTEHFLVRHDRGVPAAFVRDVAAALEQELARSQKALGMPVARKIPVVLSSSELRYRAESKSAAFDDGDTKGGTIHLSSPALKKDRDAWGRLFARVVAKAVAGEARFCPPWLADAYGLHSGAETKRFGDPARVAIASFGDLFEEYNRAERPRDVREVYAKLGFTIDFLVERFGEEKVRALIARFHAANDFDGNFERTFGEPVQATEAAWAAALRASARR